MREKNIKTIPPPAPTESTVGPCGTTIPVSRMSWHLKLPNTHTTHMLSRDVLKINGTMTNSVASDQTAPKEQSGLGLHCLLRYLHTHILGVLVTVIYSILNLND